MRLRRSRLITPVVLGVAVVTFAALAASSHGFPVQHVSLNDGGIWVTNNSIGTIGRFTKPIGQLDGELAPPSSSTSVDVWQDGPVVAAYDASGGRIYAVNVYGTAFYDAGAAISPAAGGIALGDETVAVLSTDHSLRATTLSAGGGSLAALSASAKPLAAHLAADSAVSVGSDDTVWLAGGAELRSYPQDGKPQTIALPLSATDPLQVTTVGDVPVVADTTTKTIYLPDSGHTVTLPSSDTSAVLRAATVVGRERRRGRRHDPGAVQRGPRVRPAHHAQQRAQRHRGRPGSGGRLRPRRLGQRRHRQLRPYLRLAAAGGELRPAQHLRPAQCLPPARCSSSRSTTPRAPRSWSSVSTTARWCSTTRPTAASSSSTPTSPTSARSGRRSTPRATAPTRHRPSRSRRRRSSRPSPTRRASGRGPRPWCTSSTSTRGRLAPTRSPRSASPTSRASPSRSRPTRRPSWPR